MIVDVMIPKQTVYLRNSANYSRPWHLSTFNDDKFVSIDLTGAGFRFKVLYSMLVF